MRIFLIILFSQFGLISMAQSRETVVTTDILAEKLGDLDKDGIAEKVIVFNTKDSTEFGFVRELQILKQKNGALETWKKSTNAVLKSEEGGMMGEPFEGVEIKNGLLILSFSGGSSWKWSYTDKYRFQNNEFALIGHDGIYGENCEYWTIYEFNLSTGKVVIKKEFEDCEKDSEIYKTENETFFKKGIRITLKERKKEEIRIVSPKYKDEIFL